MNAKEELVQLLTRYKLTFIGGWFCYNEDYFSCPETKRFEDYPNVDEFLNDLDFEYSPDSSAMQHLYGEIYCYDADRKPTWLKRVKWYDAPEEWDVISIPQFFYKTPTWANTNHLKFNSK